MKKPRLPRTQPPHCDGEGKESNDILQHESTAKPISNVAVSPRITTMPKRRRRPSQRSLEAAEAANVKILDSIPYSTFENGKLNPTSHKSRRRKSRVTIAENGSQHNRKRPRRRASVQAIEERAVDDHNIDALNQNRLARRGPKDDSSSSMSELDEDDAEGPADSNISGVELPRLKLWNDSVKAEMPDTVRFQDFAALLRKNYKVSLYVGQDKERFLEHLAGALMPSSDVALWKNGLSDYSFDRKVMVYDPQSDTVLPHEHSPCLRNLADFVLHTNGNNRQTPGKRIYAAQYTLDMDLSGQNHPQLYGTIQRLLSSGPRPDSSNERLIHCAKTADSFSCAGIAQSSTALPALQSSAAAEKDRSNNGGVEQKDEQEETAEPTGVVNINTKRPRLSFMEDPLSLVEVRKHLENQTFCDIFGLRDPYNDDLDGPPLRAIQALKCDADAAIHPTLSESALGDVSEEDYVYPFLDTSPICESPPRRKFHLFDSTNDEDYDSDTSLQGKLDNVFQSELQANQPESVLHDKRTAVEDTALILADLATSPVRHDVRKESTHFTSKENGTRCDEPGDAMVLRDLKKGKERPRYVTQAAKKRKTGDGVDALRSESLRNAITPRGTPVQPSCGPGFSSQVYLWNIGERKRSLEMVDLEKAIELCKSGGTTIYDGQDYDFDNGTFASSLSMFPYDKAKWALRDRTSGRQNLRTKVRVWSESLMAFRCHHYSPQLRNLQGWLASNRDFSVFQPSALHPSCTISERYMLHGGNQQRPVTPEVSFRKLVLNRLIPLIRTARKCRLPSHDLEEIKFWHKTKSSIEERGPFQSLREIIMLLYKNPAVELHQGQEKLLQFEKNEGFQLIPIMGQCPAELASFWNKTTSERRVRPEGDEYFRNKTVLQCLSERRELELYLGQDTPYYECVLDAVAKEADFGRFPYYYMLAFAGSTIQHTLSTGDWVLTCLDTSLVSTAAAVFWDHKMQKRVMQPDLGSFISINAYLNEHSDAVDLYLGQDMPDDFKSDVYKFCKVLSFKPGCSRLHRTLITKRCFLPISSLRERVDDTVRTSNDDDREPCSRLGECVNDAEQKRNTEEAQNATTSRLDSTRTTKKLGQLSRNPPKTRLQRSDIRVFKGAVGRSEAPIAKERSTEVSQGTTNCSEEDLDGSSDANSRTPAAYNNQHIGRGEVSSASDLEVNGTSSTAGPSSTTDNQGVGHLGKATEAWSKQARLISEAGPKILKKQLVQDLRQALREALILEVQSIEELRALAKRCRSGEFLKAAHELCSRLERVDVYACFTDTMEDGSGPSDLLAIREDLQSGLIFTIDGVARKFRLICTDLVQYYDGSTIQNEAIMVRHFGEQVISDFLGEFSTLVSEERKLTRVGNICAQAHIVGFRKSNQCEKQRSALSLKSPRKAKPAIRVSGYQSDVTFLNYRDEKGHSIMGKRHSARVLGLSIANRICEGRIGNVQDCHVCRRKVYRSDSDALYCANRVLGYCNEAVCRKCLQNVFNVDEAEFVWARQLDNWICVHCRGFCTRSRDCTKQDNSGVDRPKYTQYMDILVGWSHVTPGCQTLHLLLSKKSISGEFEPWDKAKSVEMTSPKRNSEWEVRTRLPVGFYKCRFECDGQWFVSTVILVTPNLCSEFSAQWPRTESGSHIEEPQSSDSRIFGGIHFPVGWKVSKNCGEAPVHRYCTKEGGEAIENCSRTEGYDWRRSKRHSVVQWVPDRVNIDFADRTYDGSSVIFSVSCDASPLCDPTQRTGFPRLEIGISYSTFRKAVNAFRFDHMIQNTLSGIVAGKSEIHGIGLFTLTGYQKGDFVIEYAGELIRTPISDLREERYEASGLGTYFFKIDEQQIVDATARSNRARFTNHSCDPNMRAKIVHVRGRDLVVLLATRAIPPFSELTFNYQLPYEDKKLQCLCNAWNCVGVMN